MERCGRSAFGGVSKGLLRRFIEVRGVKVEAGAIPSTGKERGSGSRRA